ncbi:hypothetical protein Y1Q_0009141 [Alligator mississippiensis]|uniref:Uncharacterized protein n=1 Tax=Alligator mississippiensis TaxID=8496 RepID=A0A151M2J1_ALLMI|nr:hypothetical protein Y1Q_0009141 [Alligator mississippiensis]
MQQLYGSVGREVQAGKDTVSQKRWNNSHFRLLRACREKTVKRWGCLGLKRKIEAPRELGRENSLLCCLGHWHSNPLLFSLSWELIKKELSEVILTFIKSCSEHFLRKVSQKSNK